MKKTKSEVSLAAPPSGGPAGRTCAYCHGRGDDGTEGHVEGECSQCNGTGLAARDPRVDPMPGDVVRATYNMVPFTVEEVGENNIIGHFGGAGLRGSLCGIRYWRDMFAKDAEILQQAPAHAPDGAGARDSVTSATAQTRGDQAERHPEIVGDQER